MLIVIDGGNGAGKSTVIKDVDSYLRGKGKKVVLTREPGGTPISEKVRDILLDPNASEMCSNTELMLFAAARAQHVEQKILPAIKRGEIVLSDRFSSTTVSFQHYGRGLSIDKINFLNDMALSGLKPSINIILDIDPLLGLKRVNSRGDGIDRMEDQEIDFLTKARTGYLKQAEDDPEHFAVIDASQNKDVVLSSVLSVIDRILKIP